MNILYLAYKMYYLTNIPIHLNLDYFWQLNQTWLNPSIFQSQVMLT